ncbi:MAG: hypothetical protein WCS48_03190, partial [Candidatus Izemoplasmatales bacterium]
MDKTTDYIFDFAKEILAIPSPSGYCQNVVSRISEEAKKFGLLVEKTKKGNAIITIKGKTDYVLGLSGHVDTLGAMVRSIASDGSVKFTTIGGPIWPTLDGEYCTILTREGKKYSGTFLSVFPASHVFKES